MVEDAEYEENEAQDDADDDLDDEEQYRIDQDEINELLKKTKLKKGNRR
jgi:hypothetical protein